MDEINIELEEDSIECKQVIASLQPGFRPSWTGEQLLKYYEERKLTEKQKLAISRYIDEQISDLENHKEEAQKFLEGGITEIKNIPWDEEMKMVSEIMPELERFPLKDLVERLNVKLNCDVDIIYNELRVQKTNTFITITSIGNLWDTVLKFSHDKEKSLDIVEELVLSEVGYRKNRKKWWQFWKE